MASEGVPPATGVAAQVTFEGFLPRMELDVAQQVSLLGEGGAALAALERTFSCGARTQHTHTPYCKAADNTQKKNREIVTYVFTGTQRSLFLSFYSFFFTFHVLGHSRF